MTSWHKTYKPKREKESDKTTRTLFLFLFLLLLLIYYCNKIIIRQYEDNESQKNLYRDYPEGQKLGFEKFQNL